MTHPITPATIRALLLDECAPALAALDMTPAAVPDDFDLRASGVVDSLGFLELVSFLEEVLEVEIDLDVLEPEELTQLGPLSRVVAAQATLAVPSEPNPSTNGFARLEQ